MCGANATDGLDAVRLRARAPTDKRRRRVVHDQVLREHSARPRCGRTYRGARHQSRTPDAPTAGAIRRYLAEFLADPRVIELPRWVWRLILHGVVLRIRPRLKAHAYASIWTPEGAPLRVNSQAIVDALEERLDDGLARYATNRKPDRVAVALGMRYGVPSISDALHALRTAGAVRIVVLPLYPQYSGSTGGATFDAVAKVLSGWRRVPALRFIDHYHDDSGYIDALAASIESVWSEHGRPDRLLFSFHGLPRRYLDAGDPYHCECHKTARLVAEKIELEPERWLIAFQSRVGREEWLRPYTDEN